jgi:hypothetical protein
LNESICSSGIIGRSKITTSDGVAVVITAYGDDGIEWNTAAGASYVLV